MSLLNQELFELAELPDFDITLTGFELPSDFIPDLPDDDLKENDNPRDFVLRIVCEDEDQQKDLFIELRDRGLKVKV
jgi:hypothetical protein